VTLELDKDKVSEESLADLFDVVVFDLDDTLVPIMSQLTPARQKTLEFMETHMPLSCKAVEERMTDVMKE
jgi:hypothetical protein